MKRICIILAAVLTGITAAAQQLTDALSAEGFENVRALKTGNVVCVALNDPAYRGTFRGPAEAIKLIGERYADCDKVEMVVEEYGTPKIAIHALKDGNRWVVDADYETAAIINALAADGVQRVSGKRNSTYGKVDMTLNPIVTLDNHRFDKLFETGVYISPTIETSLWRGNRINVQPIIPVYTNLDAGSRNRRFQLGSTNIQQDFLFGGKWYGTATAGTFRPCRAGVNVDFGCRVMPELSVGVRANWTVDSYFGKDKWYVASVDLKGRRSEVSAMLKVDYFHLPSAIQAQLAAGRFIYGDYGARLDLTRHFGDYAIGVYGVLTGGEHNAGFHFAIPVRGKRNRQGGCVRINLPEYYDLQYGMVSYYEYADQKMGTELEVRPIENRSLQYWNAHYVKRNMQRILDGIME